MCSSILYMHGGNEMRPVKLYCDFYRPRMHSLVSSRNGLLLVLSISLVRICAISGFNFTFIQYTASYSWCFYCVAVNVLVSFTRFLKLFLIKILCKTIISSNIWNLFAVGCWRVVGKCVRFGFFAADTATKQPLRLLVKCRSTAL